MFINLLILSSCHLSPSPRLKCFNKRGAASNMCNMDWSVKKRNILINFRIFHWNSSCWCCVNYDFKSNGQMTIWRFFDIWVRRKEVDPLKCNLLKNSKFKLSNPLSPHFTLKGMLAFQDSTRKYKNIKFIAFQSQVTSGNGGGQSHWQWRAKERHRELFPQKMCWRRNYSHNSTI